MAVTIKGIRVKSITIARKDEGGDTVNAEYALISSGDKVLANQSVYSDGGYHGTKFQPSEATMTAIEKAVGLYRAELEQLLGLAE